MNAVCLLIILLVCKMGESYNTKPNYSRGECSNLITEIPRIPPVPLPCTPPLSAPSPPPPFPLLTQPLLLPLSPTPAHTAPLILLELLNTDTLLSLCLQTDYVFT